MVSMILVDLCPDETKLFFPFWSTSTVWGKKKMEIKVIVINVPLN